MYSSPANLEHSLRRAIVPTGADPATRARIARMLLDLAREIEQTGGMNLTAAPGPRDHTAAVNSVAQILAAWRPQKMLSSSPLYVKQVESLVRELVAFVTMPREAYAAASTSQLIEQMDHATLVSIDAAGIVAYVAYVREHGRPLRDGFHKKARPSSDKTCNDSIAALRTFFGTALKLEGSGLHANPCDQVTWVGGRRRGGGKRGRRQMRAVTAAEARAIITTAPREWAEWYRGVAEVGMRAGAFEKLAPAHFDFSDPADPRVRPASDLTRKGVPEVIPISLELAAIVRARMERKGIAAGSGGGGGGGGGHEQPVFGKRPKRERFLRHVEAAGVAVVDERGRTLGLHGFRRFMATELASQGVAPKVIQERMGHANIETTLRYFDHLSAEHDAASDKLQSVLDGGPSVPAAAGASLARATGTKSVGVQVPRRQGFAKTEPYQLAAERREWALQGSNDRPVAVGSGGPQGTELQETVCRLVTMMISGIEPERVARVLRALAAELDAEGIAMRDAATQGVSSGMSASSSSSPPAPSVAAPISQAG